jgi:diguanylate cyclase (GGDEF)-like protein/PAS domain S-box-containing protein
MKEFLNEQSRVILNHFFDGVYVVDLQKRILFWNHSAEKLTGYTAAEAMGKCCADNLLRHINIQGSPLCENGCPLSATLADGQARAADVYLHHKNGHRVPVQVRVNPLYDSSGHICGCVEIFTDNSRYEDMFRQLRETERKLYQDELTGVGNRKFADLRMSELLGAYKEHGQPFGVLFLDIDHFKRVNDTYGHAIGDEVIRMVARNVQNGLRPTDRVCRFGGEEFVCLLPGVDREGLRMAAERARMLVELSWLDTDLGALRVTVSLGGTMVRAGDNGEQIIVRADRNMYQAKQSGRNQVVVDEN